MARWLSRFAGHDAVDKDALLASARFVVIDTELTSLDKKTNRLLSVGAIGMTGNKIRVGEQFYRVVNPGVEVPKESVLIHQLRPEDVKRGGDLRSTLAVLREFLGDAILVGHFAEIDRDVLRKEFVACGDKLKNAMVCTARVQRWIVKKQPYKEDRFRELETTDLESLGKVYQLDFHVAHHALDDAFVTAGLWQKQMHILEGLGVTTAGGLLRIASV